MLTWLPSNVRIIWSLHLALTVVVTVLISFSLSSRLAMIDVVQWRASIGTWNKCSRSCKISDAKQLSFTDVISTKLLLLLVNAGSSFIIVLSLLLLLLVCGDIETNPGPLLTGKTNTILTWSLIKMITEYYLRSYYRKTFLILAIV